MTQFSDLGLAAPLLKALTAEGYTQPTPIQQKAIPIVLEGRDLIGLAQTGTGKTAAFALPILQRLMDNRRHAGATRCRTLVLAPTRELAAQIGQSFRAYGRFLGLSTAVVFGGASMHKQREALSRGVDVLVATPGRLLDHISQRSARLDGIEILVLDEADHMLDMGFIHDLRRIAKLVPAERQTLFFSATMPAPIAELAGQFLHDAIRVAVTPVSSTTERVEQSVIHVAQSKKAELLEALLEDKSITRALVFTRTKHGANRLADRLADSGFSVDAIHGNKSQGQRERALEAFKKGRARLLVATEIAARGIDVDDVSHVINYDLPNVPEQYVHRVGRTARAGAVGRAISFCAPDERSYLRDIERLAKLTVTVVQHPLGLTQGERAERYNGPAPHTVRGGKPQGQGRPQGHGKPQGNGYGHGKTQGRPDARPDGRAPSRAPQGPKPARHAHADHDHGGRHDRPSNRAPAKTPGGPRPARRRRPAHAL